MGTPGHMWHPFDLPSVNTGSDLLGFFNDAVRRLKTAPGSIKWDGINVSFKLVTNEDGQKEFRMDRGSSEPASVIGMTAQDAYAKWEPGHGMPPAIEDLLKIFNTALPSIETELKALGMWDDSTKYFNTEYMPEGGINVIQYDRNILAIHGINQFYEKKAQPWRIKQGIGMDRPGLERPVDPITGEVATGGGTEIEYNKDTLSTLIEKVKPIAIKEEFGNFHLVGDQPVELIKDVNFSSTLSSPLTINYGYDAEGELFSDTKPLREWLNEAVNPRDSKVTLTNGKVVGALSKLIYIETWENGTLIVDLLEDGEEFWENMIEGNPVEGTDVQKAIDGAIFYHATRMLGNDVLNASTNEAFGNLADHEGIILRGMAEKPVKITGEFILKSLEGRIGKLLEENLKEQLNPKSKLALLAGGFKPPHKGHLAMLKHYYRLVGPNGKVIILMGSGGNQPRTINGRPVTLQDSMEIWQTFLRNDPEIDWPSDRIEFQNVEGVGPIAPIIDYVKEQAPEDQIVLLGAGEKDEERWPKIMADPENNPRGIALQTTPAPNIIDEQGNPLSASVMRNAIENKDFETFKSYIPQTSLHMAEDIYIKLSGALLMERKEDDPLPLGIFLGLVEENVNKYLNENSGRPLDPVAHSRAPNFRVQVWNDDANVVEEEELEETSAVASVQGYSGVVGEETESLIREEDELIEEVVNYLLRNNGAK